VLAALPRAGISRAALDRLNVVHVAGTKGKGTTCAMVASILHEARPKAKIGLHTSPHLVSARERVRIAGEPVTEAQFASSFFAVWDTLAAACARDGLPFDGTTPIDPDRPGLRPRYARFLTLVAFDVFLREGVDVAIVETGIGGENDATNVVERPAAVGITSLGMDHIDVLGNTIEQIAWHKGGIMKHGSPAFTVEQDYSVTVDVLDKRAAEKGIHLETVGVDPRLRAVSIRPDAEFQRKNASLAVKLAEAVLPRLDATFRPGPTLPPSFVRGLERVRWRGRCEVKPDDRGFTWYFDCAHTLESMRVAARWFAESSRGRRSVLVFNQQTRATATSLLDAIHDSGVFFTKAFFCSPVINHSSLKEGKLVGRKYSCSHIPRRHRRHR